MAWEKLASVKVGSAMGSAVDGTNSGITLITSGEALNTAVVDFGNITAQGNWEKTGSGGALTFTNGINQESGGSGNTQMPYLDLQNSSYLGSGNYASETKWTLRWKQTWASSPDNYGTPFMVLSSTTGYQSASQNYIGIRFDGSSITAGGETSSAVDGASSSTGVSTSYTSTTYYMELVRDGSNIYVRNYTSSAYDTIAQESSAISIGSGTYNLRYIKMIPRWDTGSGDYDTTWDNIKFYNGVAFQLKQNKLGTGAYTYDGSNDYTECGSAGDWNFLHDGTVNTVAFFVKRDGTQASSEPCVIDTQGASASNTGMSIYWSNNSPGTLTCLISDGTGSDTKSVSCGDITNGEWTHIAIVNDGTNLTSYKNGDQEAQTSLSGFTPSVSAPSYTLNIGRNARSSAYFKGNVDDLSFWRRALSATEIGKLAKNNVAGLGSVADGTISGATLVDMNNYATFNGSSSYISTSGTQSDTDFQVGDSFSISLWFKTTSTSFQSIINRWGTQNGGGNNGWSLLDSGTAISFRFSSSWSSNAIRVNTSSDNAFSDGNWHHLVMTYNGTGHGGVIFYLDGAVKSSSADLTGSVGSITYSLGLALGAYSDGYTDKYNGSMKQALIYSDVLSSGEVTTLYNSGTPVTSPSTSNLVARYDLGTDANDSQGSINGTATNITFVSDAIKLGTGAYSLSGSTPIYFANANNNKLLPETGDFTIACWVKHSGHSDHQQIFRSQDSTGSSKGEFRINHSGTSSQDDKLALTLNDGTNGTGGNSATVMTTNSVPQNEWVHLACTRTGATVKFYINGVLETNQNTSGTFSANMKWGDDTPRIGRMENANETLQGSIDDLAVWHRVLTATEIGKLVNNNGEENYLSESSTGQKQLDESANKYGIKLASDNPLIGKTLKSITFSMKKNNSPTGSVQAKIYKNDSTSATATSTTTLNVSTLTTSFVDKTFEFASGVTLASGDRIVVEGGSHDGTNQIMFEQHTTSFSDTVTIARYTSSWIDGISGDFLYKLTSTNADAQLVSSLSNTTGLKAYYPLDSNANNSATAGEGQLATSLADQTKLSAYYNMDTAPSGARVDDDFSSYANQSSADAVWESSDTAKVRVNITDNDIDFDSVEDNSNDSISYDLGSTVSNTKWLCRFKFNISTADNSGLQPGQDRHAVVIGLFDVDETVGFHSSTSKSGVYLDLHLDRDGTDRTYFARVSDTTGSFDGAGQTTWSSFSTGTDYYCEIKRTSGTNATMTIRTGSHSGSTALGTPLTLTSLSGLDGLRYFGIKCSQWGYGGRLTGTVDDVQVWDDTNTPIDSTITNNHSVPTGESAIGDSLNTGVFTAKKYLKVHMKGKASSDISFKLQFNGDTGSTYSFRNSLNSATDPSPDTGASYLNVGTSFTGTANLFTDMDIINISDQEKLVIAETVGSQSGASNEMERKEFVGKWSNTASQISRIVATNSGSGNYDEGTAIIVYGTD